jgi:hypothetical protein
MELFDWNYYLKKNEDLENCGIVTREQLYEHWCNYGKAEKREYKFLENKTEYYITNIEYLLDKKFITKSEAWDMIIQIKNEGDKTEYDNFDWEYYIKANKNYIKHSITNKKDALLHWNNIGKFNENIKYIEDDFEIEKITKDNFDWIYYLKNNLDLVKNNVLNLNSAWEHWCNYGKYERRLYKCKYDKNITYETFDWEYYLENNLDLKGKGFTQEGVWQHWIYYGRNEDRKIRLYNEDEIKELKEEIKKIEELNFIYKNNNINEIYEETETSINNINIFDNDYDKKEIEDYL